MSGSGSATNQTSQASEARSKRLAFAALLVLCLGALAIRWTGIGFLLPHAWEPDSLVFVRQLEHIQGGTANAADDVWNGYYPHLVPRIASLVPYEPRVPTDHDLAANLAAASSSRIHIRTVIALLATLLVPLTYVFARRFVPRAPALVAAGLMATSLLHVWFSQETRPHAVSAAFALLAMIAALRLRDRPALVNYACAALASVLAVCSLQSGIALLAPLVLAHVLRRPGGPRAAHLWFAGVLVATAIGVRVFYPFMFEPSSGAETLALAATGSELELSGHRIDLEAFRGLGLPVVVSTIRSYEPVLCGLSLLALVALAWGAYERRPQGSNPAAPSHAGWRARVAGREDLLVVLVYVVPYTIVICLYAHTYQRFVIPLLPYLATLGVFGLFACVDRLVYLRGRVAGGAAAARVLGITLVLLQAWAAIKLASVRTQPDTLQRAAAWVHAHVAPQPAVLAHSAGLDLPLWRTRASLERILPEVATTMPWIVHQRAVGAPPGDENAFDLVPIPTQSHEHRVAITANPAAFLRGLGATHVILDTFTSRFRPFEEPIRRGARASGHLVARFSPLAVDFGDENPLGYQDDYFDTRPSWFLWVLIARSMGPVIEVYELDPGSIPGSSSDSRPPR